MAALAYPNGSGIIQEHDAGIIGDVVAVVAICADRRLGACLGLPLRQEGMKMVVELPRFRDIAVALEAILVRNGNILHCWLIVMATHKRDDVRCARG